MSVISISKFGGIEPSVLARALPPEASQRCVNMTPDTFDFRPMPSDVAVATQAVSNPATLYRFDRKADGTFNNDETTGWIGAAALLNLARQQLNDDPTGKIYYTHADGSQPMRWHNVTGEDRQAGVPAPTTVPTITGINDSYVFTNEVKTQELTTALEQAVWYAKSAASPSWAGPATLPEGWIRSSVFAIEGSPGYEAAQREVLRVFAVNPATDEVIDTYSPMFGALAWLFDSRLGGFFSSLPSGDPRIPSWAAGHTKWWCIPMRVYAQVFDVDEVALRQNLLTIKKPGTQGAEDLLTPEYADAMVAALVEHGDKDSARVKAKIDAMVSKVDSLQAIFTAGAMTAMSSVVAGFYARPDVAAAIESAKDVYANAIWEHVKTIASATATPYYSSDNFA